MTLPLLHFINYRYIDGKKVQPIVARSDRRVASALGRCHDLEPTSTGRPPRDAGWIKKEIGSIRANVSKVREKFHQSGNQDADDLVGEWINFCEKKGGGKEQVPSYTHYADFVCYFSFAYHYALIKLPQS